MNDKRASEGGTSVVMDASGQIVEKGYYMPWGGTRGDETITSTDARNNIQFFHNHSMSLFYESIKVIGSFLSNSDYGKPYDLKEALNDIFFPGKGDPKKYTLIAGYYYRFDIWGNMYFGYMGARLGIPLEVLLQGAGWAQKRNDYPKEKRDENAFLYKKYDYVTDQAAVTKGYYLWEKFSDEITIQDILSVLDVSLDRRLESP